MACDGNASIAVEVDAGGSVETPDGGYLGAP